MLKYLLGPLGRGSGRGMLSKLLGGSPSRNEKMPLYEPHQMEAMNQLLSMGMEGIQDPYKGFQPIEEKARQGFTEQTIPGIMERFSGMGQNRMSSGLGSMLGGAGRGLETDLAAMKSQYGMQQQGNMQNLLGMGLTPQYDTIRHGRQPGMMGSMGGLAGSVLPKILSMLFGL